MAKKPTISTVASGYQGTATINNNFQNIRDQFDNTLSRDGSTPNAMLADLDMNGYSILNVGANNGSGFLTVAAADARYVNQTGDTMTGSLTTPALYTNGLYINGNPVLPDTLTYNGIVKETITATSGQTVFNLTSISYTPGINNLSVYVDGVYQKPSNYTETNATRVTFSVGLHVGAIVDFVVLGINSLGGTADAVNLTYTAPGTGANTRTVYSKFSDTVSVKDFGAVGDGITNDTAAIQEAITAGRRIYFPKGTYKCNIDLTGVEGKYLEGEAQGQGGTGGSATGVRLIPQDNTKPLIDVVGPSIDVIIENLFLDSQLDGNFSHTNIGIRFQAFSPNYIWRSAIRHVFIRGFQDGLVIDCDINASEIFDCDFQDIETIGCSRYSFKTRGVYNRFGKLFATQCGILGGTQPTADYGFYHDGSGCFFDSAVSDGRQYWGGTRNFVGIALIEAIYGPGHGGAGFPAMELSGTQFNIWQQVTLNGVPDSKYKVGIRIAGTNQTIGTAVIEGVNYPSTGFLFASSSGVLTTAEAPGAKTAQPANWNFLGDVSGAIEGGGPQPLPWVFKSAWNGTSFIVDMGTYNLVLDPNASPLASGTLTMPQANPPLDGQTLTISTTKTITSMEFKTTGIYFFYDGSQSITQTFSAGTSRSFIFRLSNYTWYPL